MSQQIAKEERSLGDLFTDLANDTGRLVRQEVALAQAELTAKASKVGKNVAYLVIGGAVGYAAALALIAALIIGLSYFIPAWAAALVVGVVVGVAAFIMISSGLSALRRTELTPRETVESLKEDAQWLKNQVS